MKGHEYTTMYCIQTTKLEPGTVRPRLYYANCIYANTGHDVR